METAGANSVTAIRLYFTAVVMMAAVSGQVNVLTYHNDLARTGLNAAEPLLTKAAVGGTQFGKLFENPVDGSVYAQPLYVSQMNIAGKGVHNVVFVATEHDSVYAFDANSQGDPLWHVSFIDPGAGITTVPAQTTGCGQIAPELGITGTPVIELPTSTLYVVATTLENGQYLHRLHALDISNGAERAGSPVTIQASVPGTGEGGSTVTFVPKNYKQRPGLLLFNGQVYTTWSSHCDIGKYHGWVIAYDARTLQRTAVYNNTANGNEGSFWASGAAPAVDSGGNIYLVAGNGTFDADSGGPDLGEAFIKLSTNNGLSVSDWFAPYNAAALNSADLDIGSSGALLLPDEAGSPQHPHLLVSAGKEGRIYVVDRDRMGRFQSGSDSQIPLSLPKTIGALFGIPAYFHNTVYFSGSGDALKAFPIQNGALSNSPSSRSAAVFGFPGSVPSISSNGAADGIVWTVEPSGNGRLHAYDASDLSKELFNSGKRTADSLGSYVKFSTPTVANGAVYAGTQNSVAVFGVAGPVVSTATGVNAADFKPGPVAPGSLVALFGSFGASASTASTTVAIDNKTAPLLYAGSNQINLQVPSAITSNSVAGTVAVNGTTVAMFTLTILPTAPAVFGIVPSSAAAGTIVTAYLTGQGGVTPPVADGTAAPVKPLSVVTAPVTVLVGNQSAEVLFAGLSPGLVGVAQVNFRIPDLAVGSYSVVIQAGDFASKPVSLAITR